MSFLRKATTDKSLASTLVLVLMEIELTYALVACTLSTSKNFTEGFTTGFGMGHIRDAADSYSMSNVGGSGGRSTGKDHQRYSTTTGTHDYPPPVVADSSSRTVHRKTPSHEYEEEQGLQLRSRPRGESQTAIHADRGYWGENVSVSSESDDLVIIRQTEFTISHDEAPILQKHAEKQNS